MVKNDTSIYHILTVMLYIVMVENDECIHHILKVILFIFMVENDDCIHHIFKPTLYICLEDIMMNISAVMLYTFDGFNECIHHELVVML